MERRRELRVRSDQELLITVLRSTRAKMQGRAVDLSGRGIRVLVPEHLAPGDAVKIEMEDALVLGEVCFCQSQGDRYIAGIEVDQALNGLAQLASLNAALLGDPSAPRAPAPDVVKTTRHSDLLVPSRH